MRGPIHDYWTARARGLLYTREVASAEELADTVSMPVEVMLEYAEPFMSEQTFEECAQECVKSAQGRTA